MGGAATDRGENNLTQSRRLTVFIAEDSKPYAEMLAELISEPGRIEVVGFADSESAAIDRIVHLRPDVVILDMQLRSGYGPAVIRAVRSSPGLQDTKLIVMSNHTSPRFRARCLELGADFFFDKSKDFDPLTAALAELRTGRYGAAE